MPMHYEEKSRSARRDWSAVKEVMVDETSAGRKYIGM